MNDIISKSNQPNAPTPPAILPSLLPTANHCSENCGHFAARLLCLGSLSENYLPIVCGYSEFVCQARLLRLGCLRIICLLAHVPLGLSVLGCFHRDYIVVFFCETGVYNKVNRCLARYSPRATTANRPTNRALNKPAWPGPN